MAKRRRPAAKLPPTAVERRLQELYAQIPDPGCTGACHGACCFVQASDHERRKLERVTGKKLTTIDAAYDPTCAQGAAAASNARPFGASRVGSDGRLLGRYRCSFLSDDGRCTAYDLRPILCRLYGAIEGLECDAGCRPEGGLLPAEKGLAIMVEAMEIGGGGKSPVSREELEVIMADPETRELALRHLRNDRIITNRAMNG